MFWLSLSSTGTAPRLSLFPVLLPLSCLPTSGLGASKKLEEETTGSAEPYWLMGYSITWCSATKFAVEEEGKWGFWVSSFPLLRDWLGINLLVEAGE